MYKLTIFKSIYIYIYILYIDLNYTKLICSLIIALAIQEVLSNGSFSIREIVQTHCIFWHYHVKECERSRLPHRTLQARINQTSRSDLRPRNADKDVEINSNRNAEHFD